jgi:hypothetical protein
MMPKRGLSCGFVGLAVPRLLVCKRRLSNASAGTFGRGLVGLLLLAGDVLLLAGDVLAWLLVWGSWAGRCGEPDGGSWRCWLCVCVCVCVDMLFIYAYTYVYICIHIVRTRTHESTNT